MEALSNIIGEINGVVWGAPMLVLILGVGLFLQVGLKFMPIARLGYGFRLLWQGREMGSEKGEISPFNALMTSLSATIGTGNIAGVATAIFLGGPGALFWMWCTALVGMATKYAEAVCAVRFREVDELGNHVGGPMYYIKNGLDKKVVLAGPMLRPVRRDRRLRHRQYGAGEFRRQRGQREFRRGALDHRHHHAGADRGRHSWRHSANWCRSPASWCRSWR